MKYYYGVVEDRNDPEKLGRVRARFFPLHSDNKDLIPTEDLPWAVVLYSTQSTLLIEPPREGTWVVGYFDDEDNQYPVIIGIVPGKINDSPNPKFGFNDPAENLEDRPLVITSRTLNLDGTGSQIEEQPPTANPSRKDETDLSRLSINEQIDKTIISHKKESIVVDVEVAGIEVGTVSDITWSEPEPPYNAKYPYNNVREFESGHIKEYDNTPGAERIHEFHRSGTFYEIHPDGSKVTKNVNDDYIITLRDEFKTNFGNKHSYTLGEQLDLFANAVIRHYQTDYTKTVDINYIVNIGENSTKNVGSNDVYFVESNYGAQAKSLTLAGEVHLGADSINEDGSPNAPKEEPVVLGDKLVTFLESLIDWIDQHAHPTPAGPSGPPVLQKGLSAINTVPPKPQLKKLLSEIVKTQ